MVKINEDTKKTVKRQIQRELRENGEKSTNQIANKIGRSHGFTQKLLKELHKNGEINKTKENWTTYWKPKDIDPEIIQKIENEEKVKTKVSLKSNWKGLYAVEIKGETIYINRSKWKSLAGKLYGGGET